LGYILAAFCKKPSGNPAQEELAKLLTAEQGKPLAEARGEIAYSAAFLEWFSEESRRIYGEVVSGVANSKQGPILQNTVSVEKNSDKFSFLNGGQISAKK
jgi:succinate-semialdehyde dehydrogenase/glutarate-semialdehyde dehydrogenase